VNWWLSKSSPHYVGEKKEKKERKEWKKKKTRCRPKTKKGHMIKVRAGTTPNFSTSETALKDTCKQPTNTQPKTEGG